MSKALATRIKGVLNDIIDHDQTGFVPGRDISTNIRKALDLIQYTELKQIEAMLISVDFEKAFDHVNYQAMFKILQYFGLGPKYIEWVKVLFKSFNLAVANAGHISRFISPSRGLYQGNPIASFLFTIIIEVLAHML